MMPRRKYPTPPGRTLLFPEPGEATEDEAAEARSLGLGEFG